MGLMSLNTQAWVQRKQQLLNVFLSGSCALCNRPSSDSVCAGCKRQVQQNQLQSSLYQGQAGLPVISWGSYEGSLKQCLASLKYDSRQDVGRFLGIELAQTWLKGVSHRRHKPGRPLIVVPVPLHGSKLQQRGFNQAETLATWFCRATHLPLYNQLLLRTQATQAQHGLNRRARFDNLASAFSVNRHQSATLNHTTAWLIDDIFTTGATAVACARVLRRHGISVAGICTVARTLSAAESQSRHC